MNIPIIKLEVEGMKYAVLHALTEHAAKMDKSIQQAVESFCTEKNIDNIVREEAHRQLEAAVREEVKNFFGWSGNGRKAVREAVQQYLDERYPVEAPKRSTTKRVARKS